MVRVYSDVRFTLVPATLIVCAVSGAGCMVSVDSQGQIVREEKRFTVSGIPDVSVVTFDGAIEIRGWDSPDVLVEIEKRGATQNAVDALEISAAQEGDRIAVEVKRPRSEGLSGIGFHRQASAKLIVSLPGRADIRARSGDGSIRLERVSGRIELRTGDGSIRASDVGGDLVLRTGDGSVVVDRADGRLDVDTGDGGVTITGRLSAVKVHTGDGSIVCRAEPETRMTENWELTTGDGSVTLYLPPDFTADLDAHTGDGSIRSDLPLSPSADPETSRRTLRGRLGEGGRQLRIRTGDGSIRLKGV